ncbi:FAD-dependent oxidoreductase [Allosediminivita pacifica]|uniref:Fumarate reductase flavoprotein subunit n=1 Tax=Allosediminivita pacifica TaxID=1267769 RepID=A0A2T6AU01_9RHOB|nr:FAD-dependent oxidoreductase [Allosediminivita pacifica]PTX47206.1 fumarate reductase flavoprotein subunit [Allosediminivita pacifica]GGB09429.1 fumarate reductase flavoprotein subunit [Allosediminivita pacifica]
MPVKPTPPGGFDIEVPVVVVGAGAAGLAAALAARDAGVEVILLERDEVPRGSTSMSQGYACAAGSRIQREAGVEDDPDTFYADIMARSKGQADPRIARTIAENSGPVIDWLMDRHGIPFRMNLPWSGFFGHSVNRMHGVPSRTGEELHESLQHAADKAGVTVVTGAHVDTVYHDPDGRVTGITLTRKDGARESLGCGGLVLATCGFGANEDMVQTHIPSFGKTPYYRYFGHEGNEGEGIQWGRDLGAALGCMDSFQGYGALAEPHGIIVNYDMIMHGGIMVNTEGKRFSNENKDISAQSLEILPQPGGIGWVVVDDARRALAEDLPEFRELVSLGAVRSADDARSLAALIGVPAEALEATLAESRAMTRGEATCPFGRDFTGSDPLSEGPLYALKVTGALFHTQGGLMVDENARVLREDGSALPNLFAGGGAACSISGHHCDGYLPAAGLCMALTLGRLAGQAAARISAEELV